MIITESTELPLDVLRNAALANAKEAMPDVHIVKEEYRTVNGVKMLYLQMDGSTQGIEFSYSGYYYSNESGTTQFVTYTSRSLFAKYKATAEEILNGLVIVK